jgi:1,2-diacylglycerol 3-beta-glucosyltransferase
MASRLLALSVLIISGLIAWVTISFSVAARVLQGAVALSIVYVAYLAWQGWRGMRIALRPRPETSEPADGPPGARPWVTLVVPARNEEAVISGAVGDLAAQRYADGRGPRFDLLVVDDGSSDATGERARLAGAAAGGRLQVLRREPAGGPRTKAAVLAFAQPMVRGEVVGVMDADSRVAPDFVDRLMRAWQADPSAAIQAQRRASNLATGWLPAAQDAEQLMDMASQCGRRATTGTAELRGNGMFVRCSTLDMVGGWNPAALTEDLDLSTRLVAAGEHVALAPQVELAEQAVQRIGDLWRQRLRWAEGGLRRLMDHGPRLLARSDLPLTRKLDFLAFSAEFLIPPLFLAALVASAVSIPLPEPADWTVPMSLFVAYGAGSFLLALAGLASHGDRGWTLVGRSGRGALFLSHWLLVVPAALARIAFGAPSRAFAQTPRRAPPHQP